MTALYRPVLVESVEQAEALPEGAIVVNDDGDRYNRLLGVGKWHSAADDRGLDEDLDPRCRPRKITALVPIEAEEEHAEEAIAEGEFIGVTRLVTPWEEA